MNDEKKKQRASQKKSELLVELSKCDEIILELRTELKNSKDKETLLNSEIRNLQSEIKYLEANKKNIELLNENIEAFEKNIKDLENKLELKEKKIEELLIDKENLLNEKSEILESKNNILQKLKEKELDAQQKDQKIFELREKFKQSSSDLLSKSMQIDKLVKKDKNMEDLEAIIQNLEAESQQKEEKTKELEDKVASLSNEIEKSQKIIEELKNIPQESIQDADADRAESIGSTQIISNLDTIIKIIKDLLPQGKSNIRLVLPEIDDVHKFELINIIKQVPTKVRINISAKIEDPSGSVIVGDLKNYCQLTDYRDKKFLALNVDSSKFLISLFTGNDNIIGIYTEELEFINLFKAAIMEPFIRGTKIT
ncbi:MAG: hypothetical protein EU532_05355 [Promethearchaeota archaeon]|nr:MAG: hypothetical protein EU532_05355 [Candidatus Lokiarchaeota archaeon]